jgi:hypothetical protein
VASVIEIRTDVARNGAALTVGLTAFDGQAPPIRAHFVMPDEAPGSLAVSEAALLATLALAMQRHAALRLHGQISQSLYHSIDLFQHACAAWWPQRYRKIPIEADLVPDRPPANTRGVVCFSGGLDSIWSAQALAADRQIEAGVLVEGYDLDHGDPGQRHQRERVRRLLDRIGVDLIVVSTNVRQALGQAVIEGAQGSYLAAVLTLLSDRFGRGFVASGLIDLTDAGEPDPVHEVTMPLLGSARFPILMHGGQISRLQKIAALARQPGLFQDLRVCLERVDDGNCGRCPKCVLNGLACVAVSGAWPAWYRDGAFDARLITTIPVTESRRRYALAIHQCAVANHRRGNWQAVLARHFAAVPSGADAAAYPSPPAQWALPLLQRGLRRGWRAMRKALPTLG